MIYICCLVFITIDVTTRTLVSTASAIASPMNFIEGNDAAVVINETRIDEFGSRIFDGYNEIAETLQTGVLVRLDDNDFHFGNFSNPLGLSCTEGYTRPAALGVVRSVLELAIYRTQVILKNMTIFYKDCRVIEESEAFLSAPLRTPCFLTIDINVMIGWAVVSSIKQKQGICKNSIDLDLGDDFIGSGTVRLFFLRSSTLYTFPLFLDYEWTKKIQEAVSRTSLVLLYDYVECLDLPEVKQTFPEFETTPNETTNDTNGYDNKTFPVNGGEYYDYSDDNWEIFNSTLTYSSLNTTATSELTNTHLTTTSKHSTTKLTLIASTKASNFATTTKPSKQFSPTPKTPDTTSTGERCSGREPSCKKEKPFIVVGQQATISHFPTKASIKQDRNESIRLPM